MPVCWARSPTFASSHAFPLTTTNRMAPSHGYTLTWVQLVQQNFSWHFHVWQMLAILSIFASTHTWTRLLPLHMRGRAKQRCLLIHLRATWRDEVDVVICSKMQWAMPTLRHHLHNCPLLPCFLPRSPCTTLATQPPSATGSPVEGVRRNSSSNASCCVAVGVTRLTKSSGVDSATTQCTSQQLIPHHFACRNMGLSHACTPSATLLIRSP